MEFDCGLASMGFHGLSAGYLVCWKGKYLGVQKGQAVKHCRGRRRSPAVSSQAPFGKLLACPGYAGWLHPVPVWREAEG